MVSRGIDALVVPTSDAHQSEYVDAADARRAFISSFTGSAGTALITQRSARLWTDGRYYLQASQQLDSDLWTLMRAGSEGVPSVHDWLGSDEFASEFVSEKKDDLIVSMNARVVSKHSALAFVRAFEGKRVQLRPLESGVDLIDDVWQELGGRPKAKYAMVRVHRLKYAGVDAGQKLEDFRRELAKLGVDAVVVAALDEVAWLLNVRGGDIESNPVVRSYLVVTRNADSRARWYIDASKLDDEARAHVAPHVDVHPYDDVFAQLGDGQWLGADATVALDLVTCSVALFDAVAKPRSVRSLIALPKALKNGAELDGMRACHVRDGAALMRFFAWLDVELERGATVTECSAADRLAEMRAEQSPEHFVSLSFDTISGSGPNGAVIHYKPEVDTCAQVTRDAMFLVDSGGQYIDGTTDITRTVHFGTATDHERHCFTRVLQGHIALDRAVFPAGTNGYQLDLLARAPLWRSGLDYRHGTGHGVGAFLNVHEGPHGISFRQSNLSVALQPGMTVTNEPGYYEDGGFGIRIEDVMLVAEADTPHRFGGTQFLRFENITWAPIQTSLVDADLMSPEELQWLNDYNNASIERLSPLLDDAAINWMRQHAKPL
jgi:Xaa-Pro aminopeptidase